MSHYVSSVEASKESNLGSSSSSRGASTKIGIVDTMCDPWEVCRQAAERVQETLGACSIEVRKQPSHKDVRLCYTPRYLFYMVEELLTNSARSTLEQAVDKEDLMANRPIKVTVCANEHSVVIRITDRGGGMSFEPADLVWSRMFCQEGGSLATPEFESQISTTPVDARTPWGVKGRSPLSGRGSGLRMCRLYSIYLGGSLEVMNMPGWGVDAYLTLRRIPSH